MRPRLKKCKAAKKGRDATTQTETLEFLHPRVVLNRVHSQKKLVKEMADKSEIGSLVTAQDKPARLSKLPSCYRLFTRPITNKENANSTLLLDDEEELLIHNVGFAKPGPLCYKKRRSKKISKSFSAPQVRQEPEEAQEKNHLEPLIEDPQETASTPDILELNLNVSSIESIAEHATQTGGSYENDQGGTVNSTQEKSAEPPPNHNNENSPGPSGSNEEPNIEPRTANTTYRMRVNGVATTITPATGTGTGPTTDSSSDESDNENTPHGRRKAKFVKIKAHTVHIHNHFYQK